MIHYDSSVFWPAGFLGALSLVFVLVGAWFWFAERPGEALPFVLTVKTEPKPDIGPRLIGGALPLEISPRAFLVAFVRDGQIEILAEKNSRAELPLASLTKLFTALTVMDNYDLTAPVAVPDDVLKTKIPDPSFFRPGDRFLIGDLLWSLLLESSNQSAEVLASVVGRDDFIRLLNHTAAGAGLTRTSFVNPSGLDPEYLEEDVNQSTAYDLLRFAVYLLENRPRLFEITATAGRPLYTLDGVFHHQQRNTNQLVSFPPDWPARIVGGKTGQTERARKNLFLVLADDESGGYLVNVILGSSDNFAETEKLIDWVYQVYDFS